MNLSQLFLDKSIKTKDKVITLGEGLLNQELLINEMLAFAEKQKASDQATCIEAIEYASKKSPSITNENVLVFVTKTLLEKEPRLKWESAKVIGNIAKLFPNQLDQAIQNLLINTENKGTVVRWASAYALAEILKLKTSYQKELLPTIEQLCQNEENNGVKKKYLDALKKIK
jgi:hypothetical protein